MGWNTEEKVIIAWGLGSDGGIATLHAQHATTTEIRFEGMRVGGFNAGPMRGNYKKVSNDEYLETAEAKRGNDWTPMFSFRFTRQSNP